MKKFNNIIVSGSLAYDTILTHPERFNGNMNGCLMIDAMVRRFGGTAGNITYNLSLLGSQPYIVASIGAQDSDYNNRIQSWHCNTDFLEEHPDHNTATCWITTDADEQQLTQFYPGAMGLQRDIDFSAIDNAFMIIAPDDPRMMEQYIDACETSNIPFIFDPGQALGILSTKLLQKALKNAYMLILNRYEFDALTKKVGKIDHPLIIRTKGGEGSEIITPQETITIAAEHVDNAVDPTGCGDAFRAGILYGLSEGWNLEKSAALGARLGAACVQHEGTQEHTFSL